MIGLSYHMLFLMNKTSKNNKTFKIKDIQKLFEVALEKSTPKDWENACRHVVDIDKSYWDQDNIM